MFLRTEIKDRVVTTTEDRRIRNIYVTCIDEITDEGLNWVSERYRVGTEKATRLHEATVAKIQNEGKIHFCTPV